MSVLPCLHAITPGDHFSPSTGSAIPTVVDGIARAATRDGTPQSVLVARGTYADRYDSAHPVEYDMAPPLSPLRRRADAAAGLLGLVRPGARSVSTPLVGGQERWEPSVVIAHNAPELVPLVDSARHRSMLFAHNALLRTYTRREMRRVLGPAAAIVCVSSFLAQETQSALPSELGDRVRVVGNGVDTDAFHPAAPNERERSALRVIFIGRTIHGKGPDVLIEALLRLGRRDIRATLVGSHGFDSAASLTPYERRLRERAAPLGDRVAFRVFTPRAAVPALLRQADVLVVPSRLHEAWGLTVTEGMATGLPVVASAVGGVPEAMGSTGIQVPPDDPDSLAEALAALADDPELRAVHGARARDHALTHDWAWSWRQLRDVIEEIA